jgi:hypothetical protein
MILVAIVMACGTKEPAAKALVADAPAAIVLAAPAPGGTVADVFGVNEALAVPDYVARTATTDQILAQLTEDAARVRSLGVRHVRLHSAVWPWLSYWASSTDRAAAVARADAAIGLAIREGLAPHVMIGPWPGNAPQQRTRSCAPADVDAYLAWVQAVVERYDGDGVDDAPGVGPGVRTWEVDNEPDLHHRAPPRGDKAAVNEDFCPPERFSDLVVRTAAVIRAADPTAVVLPGGLFDPSHPEGASYLRALWARPELAAAVDGVNLHRYPPGPGVDAVWSVVGLAHEVAPGRPVWITETSARSDGDGATLDSQARDLVALLLGALTQGVTRVYWHALVEPPGEQTRPSISRTRHLFAGGPADVDLSGPRPEWRAVAPRPAAVMLSRFMAEFGAAPRESVAGVAVSEGAVAVRIGGAVVVAAVAPGPVTAVLTLDGAWTTRPLADPAAPRAPFTGAVDVSAGPVILEPAS